MMFALLLTHLRIAGADIKEMLSRSFSENINDNFLGNWSFKGVRKPIIAAVGGFAVRKCFD